jgi:ATP-dependent DNA ligase
MRGGADCSKWLPEVAGGLAGGSHIADREVCVRDSMGCSDFDALHTRGLRRRRVAGDPPAVYCIFDLLVLNSRNGVELPLLRRKELLCSRPESCCKQYPTGHQHGPRQSATKGGGDRAPMH